MFLCAPAKRLAVQHRQPVLYLEVQGPYADALDDKGRLLAAPYLSVHEHFQALADGYAFALCDDFDQAERLYGQTVGDDGPTATNPYAGPVKVYALLIDAQGKARNENT